jgi:phospholipid/cholesterol/gamma-HCH transport system ATP-binding protein
MAPVIEVENLVAEYGSVRVLADVTFQVQPGEILTIVGVSGCGKTTLLKHLIGLLRPARGSVRLWGQDITRMEEDELDRFRARFGVSFQSGALFNSISAAENVALPMRERGLDRELIPALVRMKLSLVGLADAGDKMPADLSGGMRKRVALARALALDPELVFFDEPSAGLDPISARRLDDLILELRDGLGATVVVVTHELASIFAIGDDSVLLDADAKTMIAAGSPKKLLAESTDPRVRSFLTRGADGGEREPSGHTPSKRGNP